MKAKKALSLVMVMLLLAALLPANVFADEPEETTWYSLMQDTAVLSEGVNTANAHIVHFGGKKWFVIGYDGEGTLTQEGVLTLFSVGNFGEPKYVISTAQNGGGDNSYSPSTLRSEILKLFNGFSAAEQAAIIERTLEGGNVYFGQDGFDKDKIFGSSVTDPVWALTYGDAEGLNSTLRMADPAHPDWISGQWWLCSPADIKVDAMMVKPNGTIQTGGGQVNFERGMRCAFYLTMDSILFVSPATDGKLSGEGEDALTEVAAVTEVSEWKLTLKDESRTDFKVEQCVVSDEETGIVTIPYSGAVADENEYISALIMSESGQIKYYGRLAPAEEEGTVTVNISGKLESTDKLYLFNEHYQANSQSDYASDLIPVTLPGPGHNFEWQIDKEATCTEAGEKHEVCTVCGATRSEGTVIDMLEHSWEWVIDKESVCGESGIKHEECSSCHEKRNEETIIEPSVQHNFVWITDVWPTCTETGTMHEECLRCGFKRSEGTPVDPIGHDWDAPFYFWTDDYSEVTATRVCLNSEMHTETETVTTTSEVTKEPTATQDGERTYTAVFQNPAFGTQTKTETIPATGEDPQPQPQPGDDPVYYTILFAVNGGSAIDSLQVEEGKTIQRPADPTKDGYTFTGWFTDAACVNAFDFSQAITESMILYAGWKENDPAVLVYYTIYGSSYGSWTQGSGYDYTILVNRNVDDENCFSHYQETLIDGNKVTVSAKSGSTIITFSADTLGKLSVGQHTVTVRFDDGEVEATLTIIAGSSPSPTDSGSNRNPQTGDEAHTLLWLTMMLLSLIGMAGIILYGKSEPYQNSSYNK